jgi:hypothetical protein
MNRPLDRLYHAIPLHYVPALLQSGALYAQSVLASPKKPPGVPDGIRPRITATRRDRALGLHDYVHLSPTPHSPLIEDKLRKGYAHAILIFGGAGVLALPEVAVLPYNTKAWRTRACYEPIADTLEREALLSRYTEGKRLPSLEILVKYGLPLEFLTTVAFIDDREHTAVGAVLDSIGIDGQKLGIMPEIFPGSERYTAGNWDVIMEYFERCRIMGVILPPPDIAFD